MRRIPGWRGRMEKFVDGVKATPFAWHDFDCGPAWAATHVDLMLGTRLAEQYRGRYSDARSLVQMVRGDGHADLADLVSSHLEPIHPSEARIGDLAAVAGDGPLGYSLGIVNGARILVLAKDGVATVDLLSASRAWRVGNA